MTLAEVSGLTVRFPGQTRPALREVSFTVAAGECLALVGETGAGKSVAARALLGLAGRGAEVRARTLRVDGRDATAFTESQWRRVRGAKIGMVLQDALSSLDPLRRIGDEIAEPLLLHGFGGDVTGRVVELLRQVGVPEPEARRTQYPHELSGGLRQRALIATAIAADPPLIVADEPSTALDVLVQEQVLDLLAEAKAAGRGILLISHDLGVVARLADRVAVLRDGEIVESGPIGRVLDEPAHPYTRLLVEAIPERRPARSDGPDPDASTVLSATGVGKRYGARRALHDVSFRLRAGETLGVVGESGSGKSTLARIVLGLLDPDTGELRLQEGPWSGEPERRRRPRRGALQFIQQNPGAAFDPRHTVARIIGEGVRERGRARRARVRELLGTVGLAEELLGRRPHQLSGGQRQRVAIARALGPRPAVLVCDEPVSALDVSVQGRVLDMLVELQRSTGVALLFISHDLAVVRQISHRIMIMKAGEVVEEGGNTEIFTAARHPYSRALLAASGRSFTTRPSRSHQGGEW